MEELTLRYFDAEMRYLRDAAQEFARLHPAQAAAMGLLTPGAADEVVERLFQGFAFLMGRLREKLDDDFPELTEGLISLLWPHYLRPIPSMSVVEIAPDIQALKLSEHIESHTEVISRPVGDHRMRCRYRTVQSLTLHPLQLTRATLFTEPHGSQAIRLRFECGTIADWRQVNLTRLPVYLNGDAPLASMLHLYLTRRTGQMSLRLPGESDRQPFDGRFCATGFEDAAHLWPVENNDYSGYQHLLEYFTFRQKFMFVALEGLEQVNWPEALLWFELDIPLTQPWPRDFSFDEQHLRLHCVPVVNLFRLDAKPLQINAQQTEYPLHPLRDDDPHTEIFAVERVATSFLEDAVQYTPFRHFQHHGGMLRYHRPVRYYHTRLRRGPSGRNDTLLILGGEAFERERQLPEESLALSLMGTNGTLPRKALQSILFDNLVSTTQTPVTVQNLCTPSQPCYPPNRDRFHWKLLSQLGSSFLWMMDNADVLRNTLALYDWTENLDNQRRREAITEVKHHRLQYFKHGGLQRGVDIEVTVETDGFAGEGDVWLFGCLLNRFFAIYADIHLFNRLTLIQHPSGHCLRWKENHNPRIPG
ncbi:type VI secretion system baseplate subunit TssF [Acerihabitans sp. TG2]|uniref:type VI secretion system baseplate subunit TssF n=1 Tax=Acerihabitans sp. TG2 TaxID=3096008 RepID=UPI002B22EF6F|nr:type VI secretion system baseplate subunit TssF [Acerihabitans sp. TG2]MEA9393060.1 type VI secretion system baseplate subunit TssF [Acerihabitans sp. TG2]